MKNTDKINNRDKLMYLNIIAEMQAEHARELAEKDELIAYYAKSAELAADRKRRAIRNAERRAKLNISYALLLIAGMTVIPWLLWLIDTAMKNSWLWANGR